MPLRRSLTGRDQAPASCLRSLLALLTTGAAIVASSVPLYAIGYHQGDRPVIGVGACFLLGAITNATMSVQALDRMDRAYLQAQWQRMIALLCLSVVWTMFYFRLIAPNVVAALSLEPEIIGLARNTYAQPLKPISHITLAFAVWGGFQLIFVNRAVQARKRDYVLHLPEVGETSELNGAVWRSITLALFTFGLGALYSWLLLPCFIGVVLFFHHSQRRLI